MIDELDIIRDHGFEFVGYYTEPVRSFRQFRNGPTNTVMIFERTTDDPQRAPFIGVDRILCVIRDRYEMWTVNGNPAGSFIPTLRDLIANLQRQAEVLARHKDNRLYNDGRTYNPKVIRY